MLCNPAARSTETVACNMWFETCLAQGFDFVLPEIADYEIRRELLLGNRLLSLQRLDALKASLKYVPLNTPIMQRAAEFWAQARRRGRPTARNVALDGDMILCAQWDWLRTQADDVVIATTNVQHLAEFSRALTWRDI